MTHHDAPLSPRPLSHLTAARPRVMTVRALREHGVTPAGAAERCRPGGPWQMLLPGVCLLHGGIPTPEERLRAALLYAADGRGARSGAEPGGPAESVGCPAMLTGPVALTLHRFACAPSLRALDRIDVLVPRGRRPRSTGCARIVRGGQGLPEPVEITGLPVAPVPRALADAVSVLTDAVAVRRLLTESVRGGHCEAQAVVRELTRARLLGRPHVVDAVDALLAEGRALAEGRLYDMVLGHGLPEPCWNVELRLPGGPPLGSVDAYWPEDAVALVIDARTPRQSAAGPGGGEGADECGEHDAAVWTEYARRRETLERLGITVVHVTPRKLRESLAQQAAVVRTALMTSDERGPSAFVSVLPR
ncbi:hypothetical protein [Streptomyces boncukensis]|uniref:DUF559 domain-containing protein n=1 Tax=Streptomyces boncukensis TaxID=2711219 RepID=A0A6G4X3R4_9ACTN|nr:hypothetical protein [Streptomyces boncukensis]NGO72179.1 hypothetical protein [Streptomyces boncukensis]